MDEIMGGKASPVQMSAFLTAMAMKGETIEEITACAAGMRKHCVRLLHDQDVLEIVGTGGDHSNSFNISTTSSLVISAAGVPVAKHGNRAASSKSGAGCAGRSDDSRAYFAGKRRGNIPCGRDDRPDLSSFRRTVRKRLCTQQRHFSDVRR